MAARLAEVDALINQCVQQQNAITQKLLTLQGSKSEINYWMMSWADDIQPDLSQAVSFAGSFKERASTGAEVVELGEAKAG